MLRLKSRFYLRKGIEGTWETHECPVNTSPLHQHSPLPSCLCHDDLGFLFPVGNMLSEVLIPCCLLHRTGNLPKLGLLYLVWLLLFLRPLSRSRDSLFFFFSLSMKNPWQSCSPGLTRSSAHLSWNYFFRFSLWQQDNTKHREMQTMVRHEYPRETDKN